MQVIATVLRAVLSLAWALLRAALSLARVCAAALFALVLRYL